MDHENNIHDNGNEKENFVPFDIENFSSKETNSVDCSSNGTISFESHKNLAQKSTKSPVSAADVLKTLFFILVWYTFSTFLTL